MRVSDRVNPLPHVWMRSAVRPLRCCAETAPHSRREPQSSQAGGSLPAPFVLHVVVCDPVKKVGRELLRKALVSAWQRAGDWGLAVIATPPIGVSGGQLTLQESATLLAETFPKGGDSRLHIVVDSEADSSVVETIVRRMM